MHSQVVLRYIRLLFQARQKQHLMGGPKRKSRKSRGEFRVSVHKTHEEWIDVVRGSACLMVILLHSAAPFVIRMNPESGGWQVANIIDSFVRICVPLFFMISGYLFLGEKSPRAHHLERIFTSLVFYSILAALVLWVGRGQFPITEIEQSYRSPVFYHLWYFYSLFWVYLICMLISVRSILSMRSVFILLILTLVLNDSGPLVSEGPVALQGASIKYTLYAVLGYVLGHVLPDLSAGRKVILKIFSVLSFIASSIIISMMTKDASLAEGSFVSDYYAYSGPLVAIGAISFYSWARLSDFPCVFRNLIGKVADHSLAIYGIHALVLVVVQIGVAKFMSGVYEQIFVSFGVTFFISYFVSKYIRLVDWKRLVS